LSVGERRTAVRTHSPIIEFGDEHSLSGPLMAEETADNHKNIIVDRGSKAKLG
jgi:hypothetical protein